MSEHKWFRRKRSRYSHAFMRQHDGHVEFWCGQEVDKSETKYIKLPTIRTIQCRQCLEYLANSVRTITCIAGPRHNRYSQF